MNLIFNSVEQVRSFVNFSGDVGHEQLSPSFRPAQRFLSTFVGNQLLDQLGENGATNPDEEELLNLVGVPMAALVLLRYASLNTARITDLGLMRTQTADTNDAFEWQVDRMTRSLQNTIFDGIEQLLEFLAQNLDTFPAYKESEEYKQEKSKLIPSAAIFNRYYNIKSSRLIFSTLAASMRTAESSVRRMLGDKLTGLLGTSLTDKQADQLDAARRALVYLTVARALRERLVSITEDGVQVLAISQSLTTNYRSAPSDKSLERSITYFDEQSSRFLSELAGLINDTPSNPSPEASGGSPIINRPIVSF
ncbi:DUF6712 family protein [Spirosoma oryzicola]|uniref:DUF6712 family protein n=1 Tax=Spirosoma oryzicola TaxID=2898794 RepID=UPI001E2EED37|nr:DUF6712 family protein [Spirosoma oryzicola]UHG93438.1 hypothetical protein LQ777_11150 [Spirosoma oryzicola]